MQLLSKQEDKITFDKIISGMIGYAWYSVTDYQLRMGAKDSQGNSVNSIERAVNKLDSLNCLEHTADRQPILLMIESNEKILHDEKNITVIKRTHVYEKMILLRG